MSDKIKQLAEQALMSTMVHDQMYRPEGYAHAVSKQFADKFAELILQEVTDHLMEESERLYALSWEEQNVQHAHDFDICAEKCIDLIAGLNEHFGVE